MSRLARYCAHWRSAFAQRLAHMPSRPARKRTLEPCRAARSHRETAPRALAFGGAHWQCRGLRQHQGQLFIAEHYLLCQLHQIEASRQSAFVIVRKRTIFTSMSAAEKRGRVSGQYVRQPTDWEKARTCGHRSTSGCWPALSGHAGGGVSGFTIAAGVSCDCGPGVSPLLTGMVKLHAQYFFVKQNEPKKFVSLFLLKNFCAGGENF